MWKRVTIIGVITTAALYVAKCYFAGAKCRCKRRLDCKAVVITGATSGLGKALAFEIARTGAQVVLGCRDEATALQVCREVTAATGNTSVYSLPLDLSCLASIHEFARRLHKCEYEVYALVNNAGVFYLPQHDTQDGFDETFQVNYLGAFVLTAALLDLLKKGAPSRIVNVSSQAHQLLLSPPAFLSDDNNIYPNASFTSRLELFQLYGQTKLCLNLFTRKLSQLLKDQGVSVVSVDPGNVETRIFRHFPPLSHPVLKALQWPLRFIVIKSPLEGAQTLLHAVLSRDLTSGSYLRECCECQPSKFSLRDDLAEKLWQRSLQWSGCNEKVFQPSS